MATTAVKKKTGSMKAQHVVSRVLIYALLIVVAALMLEPAPAELCGHLDEDPPADLR